MDGSLWSHELQHGTLHVLHYLLEFAQTHVHWVNDAIQPTISSSVAFFSSCPRSFSASESFVMSQLFTSGDQNIGASASASVLAVNIQGWFLCCPRDSQESSPAQQFKSVSSSVLSLLYGPALTIIHDYWKNYSFDYSNLSKVMSLLFNTLSRFVIAFLPRSKCLLISWLPSLSAVILEPKKIKSATISICFPVCHEVMGLEAMILVFECWVLSQLFHYPISSSSRGSLVSLRFLP